MRVMILLMIGIVMLTGFGLERTVPHYTDVDSVFTGTIMSPQDERYYWNCENPQGFDGLLSYRVSCLEYTGPEEVYKSHGGFNPITRFINYGWDAQSMRETDTQVIVTLRRPQREVPYCQREIFLVIPKSVNLNVPAKGDRVFFADPQHLYCESG